MKKIKVIIADDHELIIDGLRGSLSSDPELMVVGEAENGDELIKLARVELPDVILTDVKMPKIDGIEATKIIKEEMPGTEVIALSSYDEDQLIIDMLNAGAKGYLIKTAHKSEIIQAIKTVYKGDVYYCDSTNLKLADMIARRNTNPLRKVKQPKFSERELQVIELICEGFVSKQIADKLALKKRTVERYRDIIMEKMDVGNVAALVVYAITNDLYRPVR